MILETLMANFGGAIVERFFGGIVKISEAYINKQVTEIEAKKEMTTILIGATKEVEVQDSKALVETYKAFWTAADSDKTNLMKIMWAIALGSQIFVLVWSQWAVPMLFAYGLLGDKGWHAGTSAEWAYAVVLALLGMGPLVLKKGPPGSVVQADFADKFKNVLPGARK